MGSIIKQSNRLERSKVFFNKCVKFWMDSSMKAIKWSNDRRTKDGQELLFVY